MKKKIFIIAGEQSGDKIGGLVIKRLQEKADFEIEFKGIGGENMQKTGLNSIFPMNQISLMGFFEILPHIFKLKKLINLTIQIIKDFDPDIIITIDSPGFCYRVVKSVKPALRAKAVHIVAPSVWAYKPQRAAKFAAIYDLLLALLPIEPKYFLNEGLKTIFVGHFAFEQKLCVDETYFRRKHHIKNEETLLCITPGSRKGEVERHLPIFGETIKLLQASRSITTVSLAATNELKTIIEEFVAKNKLNKIIIIADDKFSAYKASNVALAKSGTNSFEIALHKTPQIVAYKMNWLSWKYIKAIALIKYATILNIIAGREIIPEFLQDNCQPNLLAEKILHLLQNEHASKQQIAEIEKVLNSLKHGHDSASYISAEEILKLF